MTATRPQPLGAIRGFSGIIWCPVYLSLCPTGHHVWVHSVLVYLLEHFFLSGHFPVSFLFPSELTVSLDSGLVEEAHVPGESDCPEHSTEQLFFLPFLSLVPFFFPIISPLHFPLAPNPPTSSVYSKGGFQTPCDPGPLLGAGSLLSPLQLWTKQLS